MFKLLLVSFLLINSYVSLATDVCVKDPSEQYAKVYPQEGKAPLLTTFYPASHQRGVYFFAAKDSCGAHSCDYVVFIKDEKDCFTQALEFTGSFSVKLGPKGQIEIVTVKSRHKESWQKFCDWKYDQQKMTLVRNAASCRLIKSH